MKFEIGSLVSVTPGSYLTEIKNGIDNPAQILLCNSTLGVIVDDLSILKIVLVQNESKDFIFVSDKFVSEI